MAGKKYDVSNTNTRTGKTSSKGSSTNRKPVAKPAQTSSSFHVAQAPSQQKEKPTISGLAEQLTALGRRSKRAGY